MAKIIHRFSILLVIFLIWFLNHSFQERQVKSIEVTEILGNEKKPDYYSENLQLRVYNDDGELHSLVKTERLTHFDDERESLVKSPQLVLYGIEGDIWEVASSSGTINDISRNLTLKNNVILRVSDKDNQQKLSIKMTDLHYNIDKQILWTDNQIFADSTQGNFVSKGLQIDLTNEQLQLKEKVKLYYDL